MTTAFQSFNLDLANIAGTISLIAIGTNVLPEIAVALGMGTRKVRDLFEWCHHLGLDDGRFVPWTYIDENGRVCTACSEYKSWSKFYKSPYCANGRRAKCKECMKTGAKSRAKKTKRSKRERWYRAEYGITLDDYEAMFEMQHGVCVICGLPQTSGRDLCVDHDHKTGRVRGLLCDTCNWGLGNFKDDSRLLANAIEYLENS